MSGLSDQTFKDFVSSAVSFDRCEHPNPRLCMARLLDAASRLMTAKSEADANLAAIDIAMLAQRVAVEVPTPLKFSAPVSPPPRAEQERGG